MKILPFIFSFLWIIGAGLFLRYSILGESGNYNVQVTFQDGTRDTIQLDRKPQLSEGDLISGLEVQASGVKTFKILNND